MKIPSGEEYIPNIDTEESTLKFSAVSSSRNSHQLKVSGEKMSIARGEKIHAGEIIAGKLAFFKSDHKNQRFFSICIKSKLL